MQINTGNSLNNWLIGLLATIGMAAVSCRSAISVPSNIISLNNMKELLWDIAQAEVYANNTLSRDTTKNLRNETLALYQKVFSIHGTTKEKFTESIKYYEAHPPKHKILLDSLLQYGNRIRSATFQNSFAKPVKAAR